LQLEDARGSDKSECMPNTLQNQLFRREERRINCGNVAAENQAKMALVPPSTMKKLISILIRQTPEK